MKIKHTDATVTTTINWTEEEKDAFIVLLGDVINDYACIGNMPEEVEELFQDFLDAF